MEKNFNRLVANGRFSHAYLFFGGRAEERRVFARRLAHYLERGVWDSSPAVLFDAKEIGGGAKPIGIDDIRDGKRFLSQLPIRSPRRTLLIDVVRPPTLQAQHAVLKVAEEPPSSALIILLVRHPETLLETLTSRFQKIYFSDRMVRPRDDEAADLVSSFFRGGPRERSEFLKSVAEDPELTERFVTMCMFLLHNNLHGRWEALKRLSTRWALMNRFTTNRRLQLEAALAGVQSA